MKKDIANCNAYFVSHFSQKKDIALRRCLLLGARTDSNRRHSEPQSDALTN